MSDQVISGLSFSWKKERNTMVYILLGMILMATLVAAQHYLKYNRIVEDFSLALNFSYQLIVYGSISLLAPLVFMLSDRFSFFQKNSNRILIIHMGLALLLALIHCIICNFILLISDLAPNIFFLPFWKKYLVGIFHFWLLAYVGLVALRHSKQKHVHASQKDTPVPKKQEHFIYDQVSIPYENILFFEAYDHYLKIHTNEKVILIRASLKKILSLLPAKQFQQVHRSYIVHMEKIRSYKPDSSGGLRLELEGNKMVKVSRSYRKKLKEILEKD